MMVMVVLVMVVLVMVVLEMAVLEMKKEQEKEEGARARERNTSMRFGIFFHRIKIGTNKHLTTPSVEYSRDTIHVQVVRATIMSANNNILHTGVHVP